MKRPGNKRPSAPGKVGRAGLVAGAVEPVQGFQHGGGLMAFDAVIDRLFCAAALDQTGLFQLSELLRHGGLGQPAGCARSPTDRSPFRRRQRICNRASDSSIVISAAVPEISPSNQDLTSA